MHLSSFIPQIGNIAAHSKYENVVDEDVALIL